MTAKQKITNTSDNPNDPWLVCVCRNTAERDGFVTCSPSGAVCPPLPRKWDGIHLCCSRCGRIVNQKTLAIIGQRDPAGLLKEADAESNDPLAVAVARAERAEQRLESIRAAMDGPASPLQLQAVLMALGDAAA